jgi:hypothetical protein
MQGIRFFLERHAPITVELCCGDETQCRYWKLEGVTGSGWWKVDGRWKVNFILYVHGAFKKYEKYRK